MRFVPFVMAAVALAQTGTDVRPWNPGFPPDVQQHLALTPAQITEILRLNNELQRVQAEKAFRASTVQSEIAQEMSREQLDATAIGLRHVELEAIQRELAARRKETLTAIQQLLTADQKTRLQTLESALRLHSTACTTVALHIMEMPPNPIIPLLQGGGSGNTSRSGFATFLLGGVPGVPVCTTGAILPAFRTGDFSAVLNPAPVPPRQP